MAEKGGYRLSPLARSDLEAIWLYTFEQWSEAQADRYYRSITAACESLAAGRARGRRVPQRLGYLKLGVGSHIIFYRQDRALINVIRILHERMDVDLHL